jgi:Zn-dependent oligopeptidase
VVSTAANLYSNFPSYPGESLQHGFSHLAQGNYASLVYCYTFSRVICVDLFTEFSLAGKTLEKEVILRYRKHILEKGGSEDAAEMVKSFMGREQNIDALKKLGCLPNLNGDSEQLRK